VTTTHDVWRWARGLGKCKLRVWEQLTSEERTTREIAHALGLKPRGVRKHLSDLAAHGLAVRGARFSWKRGPASLDEVALELGVAGEGARQRQRHAVEREQRALSRAWLRVQRRHRRTSSPDSEQFLSTRNNS
jgi:hypothetical protein